MLYIGLSDGSATVTVSVNVSVCRGFALDVTLRYEPNYFVFTNYSIRGGFGRKKKRVNRCNVS